MCKCFLLPAIVFALVNLMMALDTPGRPDATLELQSPQLPANDLSNLFKSGETVGSGDCAYAWGRVSKELGALPSKEQLQAEISKWGYDRRAKKFAKRYHKKRILDVGMGQGPWGAALIREADVAYYVGLDPDVCPPVRARTRDTSVGRTGSRLQCSRAFNATSDDPKFLKCIGGETKYHEFPFSGTQMMALYPDRLALLPGTFETLNSRIAPLVFDEILVNTVTEHLTQLHEVVKGLWDLMGTSSSHAQVYIDHHNYYSFSGHHGFPKTVSQLADAPQEMMELVDWGHLSDAASVSSNIGINRVRPGDLQSLLEVYFACSCTGSAVGQPEKARLSLERKDYFDKLGFDVEVELFVDHLFFDCSRRETPQNARGVEKLWLRHPPMDGSYHAQSLKSCTVNRAA